MMQTLSECYQDIAQNYLRWSYYSVPNVYIADKWKDKEDAFDFIKNYFELGGKGNVLDDTQLNGKIDAIKDRSPHTISVYLLGIKIAESLGINTTKRTDGYTSFLYLWFLSCLYHDVGYAYEANPKCEELMISQTYGIDGLKLICDLKRVDNRAFRTYKRELVNYYLKCHSDYRKSKPVIDHGIIGGLLLYDRLIKQFYKSYSLRPNRDEKQNDFHNDKGLHLSTRDFEKYCEAADAIIAHNIWRNTLCDYIKDSDDPERLERILPKGCIGHENELLFVLSIADTLEPLKRTKGDDCAVLDKIIIDSLSGEKGFVLRIDEDDELYNAVYKSAKSLEEWLCMSVKPEQNILNNGDITIMIKDENVIEGDDI